MCRAELETCHAELMDLRRGTTVSRLSIRYDEQLELVRASAAARADADARALAAAVEGRRVADARAEELAGAAQRAFELEEELATCFAELTAARAAAASGCVAQGAAEGAAEAAAPAVRVAPIRPATPSVSSMNSEDEGGLEPEAPPKARVDRLRDELTRAQDEAAEGRRIIASMRAKYDTQLTEACARFEERHAEAAEAAINTAAEAAAAAARADERSRADAVLVEAHQAARRHVAELEAAHAAREEQTRAAVERGVAAAVEATIEAKARLRSDAPPPSCAHGLRRERWLPDLAIPTAVRFAVTGRRGGRRCEG